MPGIIFTIDDGYVDLWYPFINYLDSVHFKLTFYISGYHELSNTEKSMLKKFQEHGHEIAYHTTNHINISEFLIKKTVNDYLQEEILPDLELMNRDSLEVKNFAYPYGQGDQKADRVLVYYFNSIRKIKVTTYFRLFELDEIYNDFPATSRIIYGAEIDHASGVSESDIIKALMRAKDEKKVIFLFCHRIGSSGDDYEISAELFKKITGYCSDHELTSFTVNNLFEKN